MNESEEARRRDAELASLRRELERADDALVSALVARVRLAGWVQLFKKGAGLPIHDPAREQEVVERFAALAAAGGVERAAAERVAREVVDAGRVPEG